MHKFDKWGAKEGDMTEARYPWMVSGDCRINSERSYRRLWLFYQ